MKKRGIIIFEISIYIVLSILLINNLFYKKVNSKEKSNVLSYNEGNYQEKYELSFYRIKVNIEINDVETKSCTFNLDGQEQETYDVENGQCNYDFSNLEDNKEYTIKIIFKNDANKETGTIERKIKTLTNLTKHIINLKNEP